jgi:glycosyltransferase involved in cell wall biosynthesis
MITVLLAAYGRLPLLKESMASALAQSHPSFEVLVVDDGSDTDTQTWLRQVESEHDKLRVIFQDHEGVAVARARGVREARGELVCILDSDDALVPFALQRLSDTLTAHPNSLLAYSQIREIRPSGTAIVVTYPKFETARAMLWATLLSPRVPFKHSGTTFRREAAIALGSYDPELPCKVDIDFYLKFMRAGHQPFLIAEPLVEFRMHKNSISRNRWLGLKVWFLLIDRYGPRNLLVRLGIKSVRGVSEGLKQLYLEVFA